METEHTPGPAKDIGYYYRELLGIIMTADHDPAAVKALIEEIHDQGYVLGQLHSDGIFPEGGEVEAAEREQRLGLDEIKARLRTEQDQQAMAQGDPVDRGLALLAEVEANAERRRQVR